VSDSAPSVPVPAGIASIAGAGAEWCRPMRPSALPSGRPQPLSAILFFLRFPTPGAPPPSQLALFSRRFVVMEPQADGQPRVFASGRRGNPVSRRGICRGLSGRLMEIEEPQLEPLKLVGPISYKVCIVVLVCGCSRIRFRVGASQRIVTTVP